MSTQIIEAYSRQSATAGVTSGGLTPVDIAKAGLKSIMAFFRNLRETYAWAQQMSSASTARWPLLGED